MPSGAALVMMSAPDETCVDCLRSKANIGRATGIRDDLIFLLDEELSSIQLCALHMEMRNTEQLLASIGLLAYKVDALKEANAALKSLIMALSPFMETELPLRRSQNNSLLLQSTMCMSVLCQVRRNVKSFTILRTL